MSFKFSQTALKDFEKEQTCPVRWKAQWLDKHPELNKEEEDPLHVFNLGKYFETKCIGSSAYDEGVLELPKKQNGDPRVIEVRILQQVENYKKLMEEGLKDPEGNVVKLDVTDVQLRLEGETEAGTVDIRAVELSPNEGQVHYIDLKLTASITSEYGPWGNIDEVDVTQMIMYNRLAQEVMGENPQMSYLVFEHGPDMNCMWMLVDVHRPALSALQLRLDTANEIIEEYNKEGWSYYPSRKECIGCPLECDQRYSGGEFQSTRITA